MDVGVKVYMFGSASEMRNSTTVRFMMDVFMNFQNTCGIDLTIGMVPYLKVELIIIILIRTNEVAEFNKSTTYIAAGN